MNELIIPPAQLTFVATNKCTAACQNCCFQCRPQNKDRLTLRKMKEYVDQAVEAYDTIEILIITGGECFTLGQDLERIIKYASDKGLLTRVVTNGYWAKSQEKATVRLKSLVESGLCEINFSTGDEHQEWVPYDNIIYGIIAGLELNLVVAVNVESSVSNKFNTKQLESDLRLEKYKPLLRKKLFFLSGAWMPFLESAEKKANAYKKNKDSPVILYHPQNRCSALFNILSIDPTNQVLACCGLTVSYISYLRLGSAKKYSLKFLYEHQFHDFLKIWLFTEGPGNVLNFCRKKLNLSQLDITKWHICQICVEIFRDEQNILILQQHYGEVFQSVMLKYTLLRKKYLKILNSKKLNP
jgi:organic radical activating enzyme